MIEVRSSGMYSTIQDLGRFGYRAYGVPVSGAMDQSAARLANRLVGNADEAAVLEITITGPSLYFNIAAVIAITGAEFEAKQNGVVIAMNKPTKIVAGTNLIFGRAKHGMRCYLAIAGGFTSEVIMGSKSMCAGITNRTTLKKGDVLQFGTQKQQIPNTASVVPQKKTNDALTLEVYKGPEFSKLPETFPKHLFNKMLTVSSKSNRMAYLLEGFEGYALPEILTAPVQPGTVQLTPSGQCIVLMRDAQTTGGYARILQLSEASIDLLAQQRPGAKVKFKLLAPRF
jgi:biotin-dependent carboxylase-like uncharacterized protein